jgi:hypothetical protein
VWSERLARWQFWILAASVPGIVAHFYMATWPGLAGAALLLAVGISLHLVNMVMTLRGIRRWSFTARSVVLGYAGLALTALFGSRWPAITCVRSCPAPSSRRSTRTSIWRCWDGSRR